MKRAESYLSGPLFLDGVRDPSRDIACFVGERQVIDLEAEIFVRKSDGGDHPFATGGRNDTQALVPIECGGPVLNGVIDVIKPLAMLAAVV